MCESWARICRPFKEPRYRFPALRAGTKTLFVVLARQATWAGEIDSSESIPGLHKRLQIRAPVLDIHACSAYHLRLWSGLGEAGQHDQVEHRQPVRLQTCQPTDYHQASQNIWKFEIHTMEVVILSWICSSVAQKIERKMVTKCARWAEETKYL